MMHDELVKQLRDNAEFLIKASSGCLSNSFSDTMRQAADAIEEMSHEYEKLAEDFNGAVELLHKRKKPRWIPVTERLPELNVACLVYNKYYGPMVGTRIDDMRFRIPGSRFPDTPTHWMPLPEPPKEET